MSIGAPQLRTCGSCQSLLSKCRTRTQCSNRKRTDWNKPAQRLLTERMRVSTLLLAMSALLAACGGENSDSNVKAPGVDESVKTRTLEAGADLMQDKTPLRALNAYMDGFHFYNGDMKSQMEA